MEMILHLSLEMFSLIDEGIKDIEVRVNDLKRKKLQIGDTLIFLKRPENSEKIIRKVKSLEYYNNLSELVENYEMKRIYFEGFSKDKYLEDMEKIYTVEEQEKYGVVAIIFK